MNDKMKKFAEWKRVVLPDGGQCLLASEYENGDTLSLYDIHHNLFRLDKEGKILWQVQRNENGKIGRRIQIGFKEWRDPFMDFILWYLDGRYELTSSVEQILSLKPDCVNVQVMTLDGYKYDLDIETGIATNVTDVSKGRREW
jgi:hypothetical protein